MVKTTEEVSKTLVARMRRRARHPAKVWGLPWGFPGLDNLTGGIHAEELSILMARPNVGKSYLMGQIAFSVAQHLRDTEDDRVVKLILCEMSAEQFQERLICARAGVRQRDVRSGYLTPAQRNVYEAVALEICAMPIEYLDETTGWKDTEAFIKGRQGRLPAWWAVDYVGIHPAGYAHLEGDDYKRISMLSGNFRLLAKHVAPGLLLSQMNRNVESTSRSNKRPMLSDLRDSGKLEQDVSGIVMGLYRPDLYLDVPDSEKDRPKPCDLTVIKHRTGPLGTVELLWVPTLPGFADISETVDGLDGGVVATPAPATDEEDEDSDGKEAA